MAHSGTRLIVVSALASLGAAAAHAQPAARAVVFHVKETVGIRRTEYPVTARLPLPKGTVTDLAHAAIVCVGTAVPAQWTTVSTWDDGSVQSLDADFNVSLDPEEDRRCELRSGTEIAAPPMPARGLLTVDARSDRVQIGAVAVATADARLASVTYRGEGIGAGANGLVLTDTMGRRLSLAGARDAVLTVVKPGPLLVALRYTATVPVDDTYSVPVELLMELPNSKTWLKTTVTVTDRLKRLKDVAIERPYALAALPALWDVGTDSGTYGVFRAATDRVTLTQTTTDGSSRWSIATGPVASPRVVEASTGTRASVAGGWGHLQDAGAAVAFALPRFGREPGVSTVTLTGGGEATYRIAPTTLGGALRLTLYEHFVATPVAIGAATNPTAMASPLVVTVEH